MHAIPPLTQLGGEMPHRGEHHGDLLRVMGDVAPFFIDLAESDRRPWRRILQCGQRQAELVTEHQSQ